MTTLFVELGVYLTKGIKNTIALSTTCLQLISMVPILFFLFWCQASETTLANLTKRQNLVEGKGFLTEA